VLVLLLKQLGLKAQKVYSLLFKIGGNVEAGFNAAANALGEFDAILRNLDTQGALKKTCFS